MSTKKKEDNTQIATNKLVILDYTTCIEHVYYVDKNVFVNPQYIRTIGFNPDNVVYMFGDIRTREHPGILLNTPK